MSAAVVWLTHAEASIFRLSAGAKPVGYRMEAQTRGHHLSSDQNKHQDVEKFFHEIATQLDGTTELLLIGPGTAKTEFRHHLEKHHHAKLAKAVVGVENADHPTEPQILALSRKFFKTYDLYNATS
jgi:stalled ribosome rescue protein Dom34